MDHVVPGCPHHAWGYEVRHVMHLLYIKIWVVRMCRYVTCKFGKDQDKSTQVRRGSAHNCRIDETIVLDVTGDQQTGETSCHTKACLFIYSVAASILWLVKCLDNLW